MSSRLDVFAKCSPAAKKVSTITELCEKILTFAATSDARIVIVGANQACHQFDYVARASLDITQTIMLRSALGRAEPLKPDAEPRVVLNSAFFNSDLQRPDKCLRRRAMSRLLCGTSSIFPMSNVNPLDQAHAVPWACRNMLVTSPPLKMASVRFYHVRDDQSKDVLVGKASMLRCRGMAFDDILSTYNKIEKENSTRGFRFEIKAAGEVDLVTRQEYEIALEREAIKA